MTVEPPKTDDIWIDTHPAPRSIRPREDLKLDLMEARDCSYPTAESYLLEVGEAQAEKEIRARWTQ